MSDNLPTIVREHKFTPSEIARICAYSKLLACPNGRPMPHSKVIDLALKHFDPTKVLAERERRA